MTLATYFVDWAQYRPPPYTFSATNLAPIIPALQEIVISFVYFCPPPGTNPMPYWALPPYGSCTDETAYTLMSVDPKDESFLATIEGFKAQNPALKVLSECAPWARNPLFPDSRERHVASAVSIGGWNFPSAYFSAMAASAETRATFISSVASWLSKNSLDGVAIDCETLSVAWRRLPSLHPPSAPVPRGVPLLAAPHQPRRDLVLRVPQRRRRRRELPL